MILREATEEDLDGILAIFNQVIATSTAVWIDDPTTKDERRQWMTELFSKGYPIFVAIDLHGVAGYGSFGEFRGRPGYRFTVEHSVHVRDGTRRTLGARNSHRQALSVQETARVPTTMTPYRVATPPPPGEVDVEVMRFAAHSRRTRWARRAAVVVALGLACAACFVPFALSPMHVTSVATASAPMNAMAPFDSTPRRLLLVHAIQTTYCPFWGTDPVDTAARVQYELDHWVRCQNGCLPFPEPSPWE